MVFCAEANDPERVRISGRVEGPFAILSLCLGMSTLLRQEPACITLASLRIHKSALQSTIAGKVPDLRLTKDRLPDHASRSRGIFME
jgi:hypothetical protein